MLDHLATAPELEQTGPDAGVVHPSQIPGELLIGHADRSRDRPELVAQELGVRPTHIGGVGELDVLPRLQDLQRARLQTGQGDPVGVCRAFAHQVVLGVLARDEPGEHGCGFFADQFCVVVLVEFVELDQGARQPRFPPDLARTQYAVEVDDLFGVDAC